jgi:DNA primase
MGRITQRTLDQIKENFPVHAVASRYMQLKRVGRDWRGLSPFNKERSPSFYAGDGWFHCFSSGEHGNVIDLVMKLEGMTFPEAVEKLGAEAGVEVTREGLARETRESQQARDDAIAALDCAQRFFVRQLRNHVPAHDYLRGRGVTGRTVRDLGIGWAPPPGRCLLEHLADEGFSLSTIVASGLSVQPDDPKRAPFAFFHGRITIPIRNRQGRVISFGARGIGGEEPKYLNGRETALFDKGRQLFNLDRARAAIARSGQAIVVEGYFDVAALTQAGIENVVATMGTSLTPEHLHLLWRIAPTVVHVGDGDAAGHRGGNRGLETALPWIAGDRRIVFAELPAGLDPDDLVRASGPAAFGKIVRSAESVADRLWAAVRADVPGEAPEDRAALERAVAHRLSVVADPGMRRAFSDELMRRARGLGTGRDRHGGASIATRVAAAVPAREAALVLAAILHPQYV